MKKQVYRKIITPKLGTKKQPLTANIQDNLETGHNPYIISAYIEVGDEPGEYFDEIVLPFDASLMGGGYVVAPEHHLDIIRFNIGGSPIDSVNLRLFNSGMECYHKEIGDLKQGGSLIPAGTVIKCTYVNCHSGRNDRIFIPEMEFAI